MTSELDLREQKILAAAKKLFLRLGPNKTTIEDIAKAAQLGKGTVYLSFKSKEEIFKRIVDQVAAQFLEKISAAAASKASPELRLEHCVAAILQNMQDIATDEGSTLEILAECKYVVQFEMAISSHRERVFHIVMEILNEGVKKGIFKENDLELKARVLLSAVESMERPWIWEKGVDSLDRGVKVLMQLFMNGLKN